MKKQWKIWLTTILIVLFLSACGGGGGGDPETTVGDSFIVYELVPDTGQSKCYYDITIDSIYNPSEQTCLAPGSAWSPDGQDGYYANNTMSYTDNNDGTVSDNVTELTWQKCTIGRSGTDCSIGTSVGYTWSAAKTQCESLDLVGGRWRLPTIIELGQIVDFSKSMSTIDSAVFPNTFSNYWSSTIHSNQVWALYVSFTQNGVSQANNPSQPYYVRCVRRG